MCHILHLLQPAKRSLLAHVGVSSRDSFSFFSNNLPCKTYFNVCKIGDAKISGRRSSSPSHPLHSFSHLMSSLTSSSSPKPRNRFIGWYLGKLESHPLPTKSITAALIYAAADLTSQMITMPSGGSIDSIRTTRMAVYGFLFLGPSQHLWFNFISRILPKRDILTTIKKILMGQTIYGPASTTTFFSYNASLQGENGSEIALKLKRDLMPTLLNGLLYWPVCDFFTYKFIPVHLQPLVNSLFSYVWTIYLTYMASLQ